MRHTLSAALLSLLLCLPALAAPTIKGERSYQDHDKIVLEGGDLDKGTQILWDVDGEAQTEQVENKLYVWAKPGRYRVTMTAINFDTKKVTKSNFTFVVQGSTPTPDPNPGPGPKPPPPDPNPSVAPIPVDGFRVLIVEDTETRQKLPAAQLKILFDKSVRDYLDGKCVVGPDSKTKEWRIWDKDVDASAESKLWQDALKRERKQTPWIIISTGKTGYEGPLPATVEETMNLLKKYGG